MKIASMIKLNTEVAANNVILIRKLSILLTRAWFLPLLRFTNPVTELRTIDPNTTKITATAMHRTAV